jgi:hypothetical protein
MTPKRPPKYYPFIVFLIMEPTASVEPTVVPKPPPVIYPQPRPPPLLSPTTDSPVSSPSSSPVKGKFYDQEDAK